MTFASQVEAWSHPPLDDIGYIASSELLKMPDDQFLSLLQQAAKNRYSGWRNSKGLWRKIMGLDSTEDKRVLDYGCGAGFEALEYAPRNKVWLADISELNLLAALRFFKLSGYRPEDLLPIRHHKPFCLPPTVDVIHCSGVLHHIPRPEPVVSRFHDWLAPDGELRLLLYSDLSYKGWQLNGTAPTLAGHMDGVGEYADWYTPDTIRARFGEWFSLEEYAYLPHGYLVARLVKA